MNKALRNVENLLRQAEANREWGEISITLKDGAPILLKKITQYRADEDLPANGSKS